MSIKELIERLIAKTSNDFLQWERQKSNQYYLVLDNGSISIEKIVINRLIDYEVKLFDEDSCFVQYSSVNEKDVDFEGLYNTIEESRKRAIERKISKVFGDV